MDFTKCDGARDFELKAAALQAKISLVESEETWKAINDGLANLTLLIQTGGALKQDPSGVMAFIRSNAKTIADCIISERSRLSGTGIVLVEELAKQLESKFLPLADTFVPAVLKTCGKTNKVFVNRGVRCIESIISYAKVPEQIPLFVSFATNDPSKIMRQSASKVLLASIQCCTVTELAPRIETIEEAIAKCAVDADPEVRKLCKSIFGSYKKKFDEDRVTTFIGSKLDPIAIKYLGIAADAASRTKGVKPGAALGGGAVRPQFDPKKRIPLRQRIGAFANNNNNNINNNVAANTVSGGIDNKKQGDNTFDENIIVFGNGNQTKPHRMARPQKMPQAQRPIPPPPQQKENPTANKPNLSSPMFNSVDRLLMSPTTKTSALRNLFNDGSSSFPSSPNEPAVKSQPKQLSSHPPSRPGSAAGTSRISSTRHSISESEGSKSEVEQSNASVDTLVAASNNLTLKSSCSSLDENSKENGGNNTNNNDANENKSPADDSHTRKEKGSKDAADNISVDPPKKQPVSATSTQRTTKARRPEPGLSFSSVQRRQQPTATRPGSSLGTRTASDPTKRRMPHAVRQPASNLATRRVEEALANKGRVRSGTASSVVSSRSRSGSNASTSSAGKSGVGSSVPGYLRPTASSSKRTAATGAAAGGSSVLSRSRSVMSDARKAATIGRGHYYNLRSNTSASPSSTGDTSARSSQMAARPMSVAEIQRPQSQAGESR
ncbi:hypothetical protein H4219_003332 [Mycoemilia scoparia]|uniref:TOG domain-containing protein n=1 Tax=Mycoemilia scoparia TaxID=417184 RepID=A0A9W7ZV18_9FUNG|nr:hypothetical protein H4219_003332 [Mycoemilia scoparia]